MTRLYVFAGVVVATLALVGGLWLALNHIGNLRAENEALRGNIETRERLDNADTSQGDAGDDRAWLDDFLGRLRPDGE